MPKTPYSFPLKSRAAIVEFLTRDGRAYDGRRYNFAWNVKTYGASFDGDSLRQHFPDLDPALDAEFQEVAESDPSLFWHWLEDASRYVGDGEWCSYPGDDQGDWQFAFAGRSGGWLVLEKWRGRDMRGIDFADMLDPEEWSFSDLRAFYRGIVCADSDFTPAKAAREVEWQAAAYRDQWESERRTEQEEQDSAVAQQIQDSRPDLAPCYA